MNILVLGSGGREHTFAWKIAQSPLCNKLFVAPGNSGTAQIATNVNIGVTDFEAIKELALNESVDMVVVGPEDPLVQGIHDFFLNDDALKHIAVIGPQKAAAELEGSKEFAKEFLYRHNIPTAAYESFTKETVEKGYTFLETLKPPYVLKADGLAAGKGVVILNDLNETRVNAQLNPVRLNSQLNRAAAVQAIYNAEIGRLDHMSANGDDVGVRVSAQGYQWRSVGENLLTNWSLDGHEAFDLWRNSPGHNANMMNENFTELGLAYIVKPSGQVYHAMVLARPQ